jgi:hypothetical protein
MDNLGGTWVKTSYNGNIRKNFAGIGFTYDPVNDWFVGPQPYPSWILDTEAKWQAPIPMPEDGKLFTWNEETLSWPEGAKRYVWNEETISWDEVK